MSADDRRTGDAGEQGVPRRGFLRALVASLVAAGATLVVGPARLTPRTTRRGPKERELCEADLDSPHDLAG